MPDTFYLAYIHTPQAGYRRNVTLQEDRTRLQVGHAGKNMAIINNLVVRPV